MVQVGLPCADVVAEPDTFYVARWGSDDADGRSPARPWQSIERVNDADLQAGQSVRFARSSEFAGTLELANSDAGADSPITVGAYCEGSAPVLTAATVLDWTDEGDGRYTATCHECPGDLKVLTVDGVPVNLARWPNSDETDEGYLLMNEAGAANPSLEGQDFRGAQAVVKTEAWILDVLPIEGHDGEVLRLGGNASGPLRPGFGFFVQNHPDALDRDGEWVWDPGTATLTVLLLDGTPTDRVQVSSAATVIDLTNASGVVVEAVELRGANGYALTAAACSEVVIRHTAVVASSGGLFLEGCSDASIEDSAVRHVLDNGLDMQDCDRCTALRNTISDVAVLAGMGGSDDGHYMAARIGGDGFEFADNTIDTVGYTAVNIDGEADVHHNVIARYDLVKVDGGGIYTFATDGPVRIADNLIVDGRGTLAGITWDEVPTHGIYIDDGSSNVIIERNRIASGGSTGVKLHNTASIDVVDNLLVDHPGGHVELEDDDRATLANTALTITGNTLLSGDEAPMFTISSDTEDYDLASIGTVDDNTYCSPFDGVSFERELPGVSTAQRRIGLDQWRAFGHAGNATVCSLDLEALADVPTGANQVPNPEFVTDEGWLVFPDVAYATHDPGAQTLLLGSLPEAGSTPLTLYSAIGSIEAGTTYRVIWTAAGPESGAEVVLSLGENSGAFGSVSSAESVTLGPGVETYEVVLVADEAVDDSRLSFVVDADEVPIVFESVVVAAAQGEVRSDDELLQIEVNTSAEPIEATVQAPSVRRDGTTFEAGDSVTIDPFRVVVLFAR